MILESLIQKAQPNLSGLEWREREERKRKTQRVCYLREREREREIVWQPVRDKDCQRERARKRNFASEKGRER